MKKPLVLWEDQKPKSVSDVIFFNDDFRKEFNGFVEQGDIPNLLLHGPPGCGKTSTSDALANDLKSQYLKVNAANDRNIDMIRDTVTNFITRSTMGKGRKIVCLDEADGLTSASQDALKSFIEKHSHVRFILSANKIGKIIDPLISRMAVYDFTPSYDPRIKREISIEISKRAMSVLIKHGFEIADDNKSKKRLFDFVQKQYPDIRSVWNTLQKYIQSSEKSLDSLGKGCYIDFDRLVNVIKDGSYDNLYKWTQSNSSLCDQHFYVDFFHYVNMNNLLKNDPNVKGEFVLASLDHQKNATMVSDQTLNTISFLVLAASEEYFK